MVIRPEESNPNLRENLVVIFDVRVPGIAERLHSERTGWRECANIEALDASHFVLIAWPGGAAQEQHA